MSYCSRLIITCVSHQQPDMLSSIEYFIFCTFHYLLSILSLVHLIKKWIGHIFYILSLTGYVITCASYHLPDMSSYISHHILNVLAPMHFICYRIYHYLRISLPIKHVIQAEILLPYKYIITK